MILANTTAYHGPIIYSLAVSIFKQATTEAKVRGGGIEQEIGEWGLENWGWGLGVGFGVLDTLNYGVLKGIVGKQVKRVFLAWVMSSIELFELRPDGFRIDIDKWRVVLNHTLLPIFAPLLTVGWNA